VAKKLNILWNFIKQLDNININGKPIRKPIKSPLERQKSPKNNIGFSQVLT
jgi:hypothetical protein